MMVALVATRKAISPKNDLTRAVSYWYPLLDYKWLWCYSSDQETMFLAVAMGV
jgi:hypothetical protein